MSKIDFTVIKPPTITSFTPATGKVGTLITVMGTNLSSATDVKFNGVSITSGITVVTPGSIKVTVPQGATTGKMLVVNRAGQATSTGTFTVTQ